MSSLVAMCLSMYSRQHRMPMENLLYPRQIGYFIGLLYTDTFMGIELNKVTIDVAPICFTPSKASKCLCFTKY